LGAIKKTKKDLKREITELVDLILDHPGKSYAIQHDLILHFINNTLFGGKGEFNKEFRVKGKKYPDLKIPIKDVNQIFEIVELKGHTCQLKYLRGELNKREEIFSTSDHLYFSYLLQVGSKEEGKVILDRPCIYYLVIIKISKQTLSVPINELVKAIKMDAKDFTKELAEKSGLDEEKEELLGVDNILKAVDLERQLKIMGTQLEEERALRKEKEKLLHQKDKVMEKKDKIMEKKDKIIEEERKLREEKEKEIERLKAQLKNE